MNRDPEYYELLGLSVSASAKDIASAYRKYSLKVHPDKNPDDPTAITRFHLLTRAYQVLTDIEARKAYDKLLHTREAQRKREESLNQGRKIMRDELLERERAYKRQKLEEEKAKEKLERELERLRREGQLRQQLDKDREDQTHRTIDELDKTLRVRWSKDRQETTESRIRDGLKNYGEIEAIAFGNSSAMINFRELVTAKAVMMDYEHNGTVLDGLEFSWARGSEPVSLQTAFAARSDHFGTKKTPVQAGTALSERDFESLTMMRMRQAQERRKMIKDLENEDRNGGGSGSGNENNSATPIEEQVRM